MKQVLFILLVIPSWSGAGETTDTASETEENVPVVSRQCSKFLEAFQVNAAHFMSESVKNYGLKSRMVTGDPRLCLKSNKCSKLLSSHKGEAKKFQDRYLQNLLEKNLSNSDRGFGLPPFVTTPAGVKISSREFSSKMKKKVFQKLKRQQKTYMADWLKMKMSKRYPRWKECIRFESQGRVALKLQKSRKDRHFYKPAYTDLESLESPELKTQCARVQGTVHASKNSRWIRNRFVADQTKAWSKYLKKQKKSVPKWLNYMDRRLSGIKSEKERKRAIASTYTKMGKELKDYVNGTGHWSLLGYGSRHGFKTKGAKTERQLWKMANSVDAYQPMLHKNCPSKPWWGVGEGISSAAKEILPGVSNVDRVSDGVDNRALALANLKSIEEFESDRVANQKEGVKNAFLDIVPGGKVIGGGLKVIGKSVGIAATRIAPEASEKLHKAVSRVVLKKATQVVHKISKGGQKLLDRMEKQGFGDTILHRKAKTAHKEVVNKLTGTVGGQVVSGASEIVEDTTEEYADDVVEYATKKTKGRTRK